MAHAALATLALALAACAGAARAEQYGGGVMPQYGAADYEHDYHARSPDAPSPLDYKYQEEPHGDSEKPAKLTEEFDRWRKSPERVQRRPVREEANEELELESKVLELEARSDRRRRKSRRGRRNESRRDLPPAPRRRPPLPASGDRLSRANSHRDQYMDGIDYRGDENKYLEDIERNPSRETTAKVLGRKPRQRVFAPPPLESTSEQKFEDFIKEEEEVKIVRPVHEELKEESDYLSGEERVMPAPAAPGRSRPPPLRRMRPIGPSSDLEPAAGSGSEDAAAREWGALRPVGADRSYPEYNDDDAMKNIENIQNKLPTLLRRPTTTLPPRRRYSPGRVDAWPERRAGQLGLRPLKVLPAERPTEPAARSTEPAAEPPAEPPAELTSEVSAQAGPTAKPYFKGLVSIVTPTPTASYAANNATNTTTYAPVAFVPAINGSELSMADKSRLSILKKAQMKESAGKGATHKPPVLLQVTTRQMMTVVMVAPATGDPWQRARVVSGDSPVMLDKVKRLMRQKLVAGAKNIRDLTDNWDDTVCDYIDVNMLESLPDGSAPVPAVSSAAERELHAVLAAHRQRKEAPLTSPALALPPLPLLPPPPTSPRPSPPTLPPASVDAALQAQWRTFVLVSAAGRPCTLSLYAAFLAVINSFIRL